MPGPTLPSVAQSVLSAFMPVRFAQECRRRYGSVFRLRVFPVGDVVCVADPVLIKEVLTSDPEVFRASDANNLMDFVVGRSSLLTMDGTEHTRHRQLLLPPFRGTSVSRYRHIVAEATAEHVRRWPVGRPLRLHPLLQDITLEVMMRAVFGITDAAKLAGLRTLVPRLLHLNPLLMLFPQLRKDFGKHSPWGRFVHVRSSIDRILFAEIARRRAEPALADRDDVLSLLLAAKYEDGAELTDQELRDQLITLLMVGHETSATAMAWVFERLARHPRVLERTVQEVEDSGTRYVDALIHETLRVRPVVMDVARVPSRAVRIGGATVPGGVMIALSLALMHTSTELYPDPASFDPERFVGSRQTSFAFLPFGGGTHRCLGAHFAMMEMREIISSVLRSRRLRPLRGPAEGVLARGPMLVPARGARVVLDQHVVN
ncbi:cytochrome P450 [Kibdelosporangium aridum]|uniref:Cytochrome P450 n=2 Tax=Kibdelosporangium aridum TaxID=2030 RepID=A0A428Z556_KIBAR|nr:cytochrome P450 [Kibdelosporangium aridum]